MLRTTRFARIALAAGIAAGSLLPVSTAFALSPPAPNFPNEIAIPEPTDPPKPGDTIGIPAPGPSCKFACIDDFANGDGRPGDEPGDEPGDGPGDEPGDGPGDEPGDGNQPGDSDDGDVGSDTVVATPNFTG